MSSENGKENATKFPAYRGKSLVRCGDVIYYGSMKDKYVVKLEIKSKKRVLDMGVADKVGIQLMYINPDIRACKRIVKSSEKEGLYLVMNAADVWLQRALSE